MKNCVGHTLQQSSKINLSHVLVDVIRSTNISLVQTNGSKSLAQIISRITLSYKFTSFIFKMCFFLNFNT